MKEYVNCQHCINKRCARYGGPYGYTFCDSYIQDTPKEKTNADRIRAMSDEELAKFLDNWLRWTSPGEKEILEYLHESAEEANNA